MAYCARCGVEVDPGTRSCPLCSTAIPLFDDEPERPSARYPMPAETLGPLSPRQIRMTVWAVLSAVVVVASILVYAVDHVWNGALTWSAYALASLGLVWALATSGILFFRRPWLVVLVDLVPILAHLALMDAFADGDLDWYITLGLPVGAGAILVLEISAILWTVWPDRGTNQVAIFVLLLAALSVGIDVVLSLHVGSDQLLSWSFVFVAVFVPLAALLFLHHYVLRKVPKLRRIFHV